MSKLLDGRILSTAVGRVLSGVSVREVSSEGLYMHGYGTVQASRAVVVAACAAGRWRGDC